jgi:hypothetical protein
MVRRRFASVVTVDWHSIMHLRGEGIELNAFGDVTAWSRRALRIVMVQRRGASVVTVDWHRTSHLCGEGIELNAFGDVTAWSHRALRIVMVPRRGAVVAVDCCCLVRVNRNTLLRGCQRGGVSLDEGKRFLGLGGARTRALVCGNMGRKPARVRGGDERKSRAKDTLKHHRDELEGGACSKRYLPRR